MDDIATVRIRFEGDPDDIAALIAAIRAGHPLDLTTNTSRRRREGFHHVYATATMAEEPPGDQ